MSSRCNRPGLIALLAVTCIVDLHTTARAADQAAYAIRWDPAQGGPKSTHQAFDALGLTHGDNKTYVVRRYTVPQPAAAPPGYGAVARERTSVSDSDATYKLRGPTPPTAALVKAWKCPLAGKAARKHEVDVGWTGDATPRLAHSLNCTVDAPAKKAFPKKLGAVPAACTSRMDRIRKGDVKAEQWTFADGRQILEVSLGEAKDSAAALDDVRRRIVEPLLTHGVQPLRDSKTELGGAC